MVIVTLLEVTRALLLPDLVRFYVVSPLQNLKGSFSQLLLISIFLIPVQGMPSFNGLDGIPSLLPIAELTINAVEAHNLSNYGLNRQY